MFRRFLLPLIAMLLLLASCTQESSGPPTIGEAFAGPSTLNIRKELTLKSPIVATVKHGDRLQLLQNRRRFVQVRTVQGAVGWIDSRQLLSPEQMQEIRKFSETTSTLPSQGAASVLETLNVHTEPTRTSPSFVQIPENASVQVIGHKASPRMAPAEPRPAPVVHKAVRSTKKSRDKERQLRHSASPPMPAAPKPPANWLELSNHSIHPPPAPVEPAPVPNRKGPVMEDWSLVRTRDNKVGWVLTRMLSMSIPDEVAQYAEGQRITSYFVLADIPDQDQVKHAWVWTTMSHGGNSYEFDGLRVFNWSVKRHRYETVYRERNLKGFYPASAMKSSAEKGAGATFSIPVEEDGQLVRKTYAFNGYRVNLLRREPYNPQAAIQIASGEQPGSPNGSAAQSRPWYSRMRAQLGSWFR